MKMTTTDALLVTLVVNPKADLRRPKFGFDLFTKETANARFAEFLMWTPNLSPLDFAQRFNKLLTTKDILEFDAAGDRSLIWIESESYAFWIQGQGSMLKYIL